jgi:hypothetical protein
MFNLRLKTTNASKDKSMYCKALKATTVSLGASQHFASKFFHTPMEKGQA